MELWWIFGINFAAKNAKNAILETINWPNWLYKYNQIMLWNGRFRRFGGSKFQKCSRSAPTMVAPCESGNMTSNFLLATPLNFCVQASFSGAKMDNPLPWKIYHFREWYPNDQYLPKIHSILSLNPLLAMICTYSICRDKTLLDPPYQFPNPFPINHDNSLICLFYERSKAQLT